MRASLAVTFTAVLVACSSGGSDSNAPDGGATVVIATPQAIARMNGGAAAACASVPAFNVGQFADATAHRPVKSGEADQDGPLVSLTCRVARNGTDFAVNLSITKGTSTLTVEDGVDANGASVTAKVSLRGGGATWSSDSCTLDASGVQMGIGPGRYWAMLTCAGATSANGETCDLFGEIRVENCAQE